MSNFYVLLRGYYPGTAATIHCLNWIKVLEGLGVRTNVVFIRPDERESELPHLFKFITIRYLWKDNYCNFKNRLLRFCLHIKNAYKFSRTVKKGDVVWVYDCPEVLPFLVGHNGVKVFNEITEHPSIRGEFLGHYYAKKIRNSIIHLDGLFVISCFLKDYFIKMGVASERIHIINMTVDSSRFEGLKKNKCEPYIAFCGNGANNKDGVDILIKAFAIFSKKINGYKLLIIGPESVWGDASGNKDLVHSLGLDESVVFTGLKDYKEIPQMLKDASILALARPDSVQAQNGFPSKLGEYLLTGNPVVVTRVGDIPLFLKDSESALLVEPGNIEAFANKLIWAHENYETALLIGANGCKVALDSFNSKIEGMKMLKFMNI